jgi:hypothetical protein
MSHQSPAPDDYPEVEAVAPRSPLQRLVRAWDRFFFKPADPTTLGMIRIFCGLIALYTLVAYSLDLQAFFGKHAWVDLESRNEFRKESPVYNQPFKWSLAPEPTRKTEEPGDKEYLAKWDVSPVLLHAQGTPIWSVWFHVTDPTAMALVHTGFILCTLLFTLGLCTRVMAAVTWFAALCYIHRASTTLFGVDTMMTIALLYLMIGPSGAALSLDRLIGRWWATRRFLRRLPAGEGPVRPPPLPVRPLVSANLAIRLFQIHVCIIYFAAGISKLQGRRWWTGEAIWGTLANFEFAPMQYPAYNSFLLFLSEHRLFWEAFMTAGTLFTLAFEIGFAFLVWNRHTRWVIIAMAVTLHGGIGLFMGLKTFSLMMLTLVLSFVPPEVLRRWLDAVARGPSGFRLAFAAGAARAAAVIHALDVWGQVELERVGGGKAGKKLALITPTGRVFTGASLYLRLFVTLGIFRAFAPWCWVIPLFVRHRPADADAPRGAKPAEPPITLRPAGDKVKTNAPHVKSMKQKR